MDGLDIVVEEFFLDTKRNPDGEWIEMMVEKCLARIESFGPDIIFTGDDNATKTVGKHFLGKDVPVVFYGLNAEPDEYGLLGKDEHKSPGQNVTGVLERHFFVDTLHLMLTICQSNDLDIKKVYMITDDSMTSEKLFNFIKNVDWKTSVEIVYLPQFSTFEGYKAALRNLEQPGVAGVIYNLQTIKDESGELVMYGDIVDWTKENLSIPTVAFHKVYIDRGLMMGITVSGYSQAYHAGLKGKAILEGAPVSKVPVDSPIKGKVVINSAQMKEKGLKIPVSVLMGATIVQ